MENKKNELEKNSILNLLKTLSTIVFPLITFPYISRVLGAVNVGKINYSLSVVGYFELLASLGVSAYGIRECSKVRYEKKKLEQIASELYTINVIMTILSLFILMICVGTVRAFRGYKLLLILQSLNILFSTLGADWINTAFEDFRYITIRTFAMQFLAMVLMLVFVRKPSDYLLYVAISLMSSCGAQAINIFYRKRYCSIKLTITSNSARHIAPVLSLFAMLLSQQIYSYLDITIIGFVEGDYSVGLYSTAYKIIGIILQLIASIAWVVMPQMSLAYSSHDYSKIKELVSYSLGFSAIIGLPCIAGILVFASEIIEIVAGQEYISASTSMRILLLSMVCSCLSNVTGNELLLACGKDKQFMKACVIGAIVNAVTNVLVIPKYGINGAAFTTFLSNFIILLLTMLYIDRESRLSLKEIEDSIKGVACGSSIILVICLLMRILFNSSTIGLIVSIPVCFMAYCLILWKCKNTVFEGVVNKVKRRFKKWIQ